MVRNLSKIVYNYNRCCATNSSRLLVHNT